MEKNKIKCPDCKTELEEGFLSTNESVIYWTKGEFGIMKSLFSKAHPMKCYTCPKCGKTDFYCKRT